MLSCLPEEATRSTLVHEMIHGWVDLVLCQRGKGHGPLFLAKMEEINAAAAGFTISVSHYHNNRVRLRQAVNPVTAGAISGGFWGSLIGLLALDPLLGAAVGAGVGAVSGALTESGHQRRFHAQPGWDPAGWHSSVVPACT